MCYSKLSCKMKILYIILIFFLLGGCQTIEKKSQEAIKNENEKLSQFLQQPESELKIVMGKPDQIIYKDKGEKFFVPKGTSFVEGVKTEGGIPIEIDIAYSKIQDHYLKNKDKVSGFITDAASWGDLMKSGKYKTLVKSQFQFPYDETAWLVEPNNYILLDKVQQILRQLHDDNTIRKKCLEKMPYLETINCGI